MKCQETVMSYAVYKKRKNNEHIRNLEAEIKHLNNLILSAVRSDELYKTKDISSIMHNGSVYKREILAESVVSLRESLSNLLVEITDFTNTKLLDK